MNMKQLHLNLVHSVETAIEGKPDVAYYLLHRMDRLPSCDGNPMPFIDRNLTSWHRFSQHADEIEGDVERAEEAITDFSSQLEMLREDPVAYFRSDYPAMLGERPTTLIEAITDPRTMLPNHDDDLKDLRPSDLDDVKMEAVETLQLQAAFAYAAVEGSMAQFRKDLGRAFTDRYHATGGTLDDETRLEIEKGGWLLASLVNEAENVRVGAGGRAR
jgi:hypothetical protein